MSVVFPLALTSAIAIWAIDRSFFTRRRKDPLPPSVQSSRFLNTRQGDRVGSHVCRQCHNEIHSSFQQTAHRQAFERVNPDAEPPPASFRQTATGRTYQVYSDGNQLRHRESVSVGGEELLLTDLALKYRVGSGHLARTYLVETEGFLTESPITWYPARQTWDMSPGYDDSNHPSFSRPVSGKCLFCHSGRVESVDGSYHRFKIHEMGIGCERCHGPGELHSQRMAADWPPEQVDESIVHPTRLARERADDVCAQCHLSGDADVAVRGRDISDFRPGLRLKDFQLSYRVVRPSAGMTLVGHVEQMRLSRCYLESESMTCTTCHDPHRQLADAQRFEFYRSKCLTCHDEQACGLSQEQRLSRRVSEGHPHRDDCVACHMPHSSTEVQHVASTHHRIGLQPVKDRPMAPHEIGRLIPIEDDSHLPPLDRERCRGLAWIELAKKSRKRNEIARYESQARRLLLKAYDGGLRDPELLAGLARVLWNRDSERALKLANEVIALPDVSGEVRSTALFIAADIDMKQNRLDRAVETLKELIRIRRHVSHWERLAECQRRMGQTAEAMGWCGSWVLAGS